MNFSKPIVFSLEDLLRIDRFQPEGAAKELIEQASQSIAEIDSHRPFASPVVEALQRQILFDRVHSSAVTEGNKLSKRETIAVLSEGVISAGSRKDELEIKNLASAIIELQNLIDSDAQISPFELRQLHGLVLENLDRTSAGKFRTEDVVISGAIAVPPHFQDVPDAVAAMLARYFEVENSLGTIASAAWLHWATARIHPFKDGNGRMARLLQDYVLLRGRCVPAPLRTEDREETYGRTAPYYEALEAADKGNGRNFLELVAKNTQRMADRYLAIIRENQERAAYVYNLTKAAKERSRQTIHRRFLLTQRATSLLKEEFYRLCVDFQENLPNLHLSFRDYGTVDFDKFQELTDQGRASRTWLFGLEVGLDDVLHRYIFWYGRHHVRPYYPSRLPSEIVILVSAEDGPKYYRLLDDLNEDRISLRELAPDGSSFFRRRFDPVKKIDVWESNCSAGRIARDFLEEAFGKIGLL